MIFQEGNFQPPDSSGCSYDMDDKLVRSGGDDMHTLEEILHGHDDACDSSHSPISHTLGSVEKLNLKNLKNSQENLTSAQISTPSFNILQLSKEEPQTHISIQETIKKTHKQDSEEKEEAEISPQKLEEDRELETIVESYNQLMAHVETENKSTNTQATRDDSIHLKQLRVNVDQTTKAPQKQENVHRLNLDNENFTSQRAMFHSSNRLAYIPDNEEYKKKKILQMEASGNSTISKVNADAMDSEKNRCKSPHHMPKSDLDDMYRLPTEHLQSIRDQDYSNERIKHKRMSKIQMQRLLRYRDEINELNERLREEGGGACGGYEEVEDRLEIDNSSVVLTGNTVVLQPATDIGTRLSMEVDIEPVASTQGQVEGTAGTNDGFSSPEDQPSSPRQPHSGARPKKSPRKQKAL